MEVGGRADADELEPDRVNLRPQPTSLRDMREARGFLAAPRLEPCEIDDPGQARIVSNPCSAAIAAASENDA